MEAHPLLPWTGIIPSPSSLEMNPDNTVRRKRRGSSCPQAGLPGQSTLPQSQAGGETGRGHTHPRH